MYVGTRLKIEGILINSWVSVNFHNQKWNYSLSDWSGLSMTDRDERGHKLD